MALKKRKIGIMGGTFDPIHIGHLILGENAYLQFALDEVWFMPSGNPPHKKHRPFRAATWQRVEMVQLAVESNEHFKLSTAEAHDAGYTYTKETLTRLKLETPETEYYFIMGADSLFAFDTWKDPGEIALLCTLVVAVRNHVNMVDLDKQIVYLTEKYHAKIFKLDTPNIDISSGTLREWISQDKSIRYYVPDEVISYIQTNAIYQRCEDE